MTGLDSTQLDVQQKPHVDNAGLGQNENFDILGKMAADRKLRDEKSRRSGKLMKTIKSDINKTYTDFLAPETEGSILGYSWAPAMVFIIAAIHRFFLVEYIDNSYRSQYENIVELAMIAGGSGYIFLILIFLFRRLAFYLNDHKSYGSEKKLDSSLMNTTDSSDRFENKDVSSREHHYNIEHNLGKYSALSSKNTDDQGLSADVLQPIQSLLSDVPGLHSIILRSLYFELQRAKDRLAAEVESLTRRGNVNLLIGIAISTLGIGILIFSLSDFNQSEMSGSKFWIYFIPRSSVALLVEIIAFFFLNLYRASLSEIKYFQNEITNLDMRLVALLASTADPKGKAFVDAGKELLKVDRNQRLKKGESTIEIEREKLNPAPFEKMFDKMLDTAVKLRGEGKGGKAGE
ncbi:hypothetical protein HHL28_15705 [Aerophototrophica crusticola]|uniref:Uncharacterized protein n=1 Tax=Aerophototrophica crusticola TaxID=1709002 RepID=A0A858RAE4_9PROT|nr:hypothetical protein HHL28_15705 [Rhodospirillaceae bacterium B3]